jgi:sugar lactone lactonase YvrE
MNHSAHRLAATMAVCALFGLGLSAAPPAFWQVSTQADLLKGDVIENLAIDSDGRLVLGPTNELLHETTAPFLWSVVPDGRGGHFVGSGNEGKVLRVAADGTASVFFDSPELEVHAMAAGPAESLFVATSPDGRIYRVMPDGTSTVFFEPQAKYVWALAVAPDGALFASTGEKAAVYRIAPDGAGAVVYTSRASNVTALAVDGRGELLIGTESPGQVLRVGRDGKAFVLLDSPFREIQSLRVDSAGVVYAVGLSGRPGAEPRPADRPASEPSGATPTATVSTEVTITAIGDVPVPVTAASTGRTATTPPREPRGAVYRITPDGLWDQVWQSNEDLPFDLAIESDGRLLVATGGKGKIYRVPTDGARTALVAQAAAQQVTRLATDPKGGIVYVTSNPGKVYRLSDAPAARGVYESDILDATNVATWGTLRWRARTPAGSGVEVTTRAGNTSRPDETWSDWSAPYERADGSAISSPNARYLQWRAVLTRKGGAEGPSLTSVTAAYLPRNMRPRVESITVHPPGVVFQKPFSTGEAELAGYESGTSDGRTGVLAAQAGAAQAQPPALGRRTFQKGLQTFAWKAEDPNDDRLQYEVSYRREGDATWRPLRRGLWDPILTWDTTSVPDGTYSIRVVASDAPSNSPDTALQGELESPTFDIDNTPPTIEFTSSRTHEGRTVVRFTVRDEQSPVQRVEYSLDATRWRLVHPLDGLADSREEVFEITLEPGSDAIPIVRAADALNNIATAVVGPPRRR